MNKLLVYKQSKLEWDSHLTGLNRSQLIKKYEKDGANVQAITEADEHQRCVLKWMKEAFHCESETLEEFTLLGAQGADLIISLGGDNSFTRVSQFCKGKTVVVGVNSDPSRSVGHLLSHSIAKESDVEELANNIHTYSFSVRAWPRIACKVNGRSIRLATSEIFLGEKLRKNMSRHVLEHQLRNPLHKREWETPQINRQEQKCSGLIVATGAGSTGWLYSASQWKPWDPRRYELRYIATEPYQRPDWTKVSDSIYPADTFRITSLNDDGIISVDSWEEWSFHRGSVAEINFGEPLNVMKFDVDMEEQKE